MYILQIVPRHPSFHLRFNVKKNVFDKCYAQMWTILCKHIKNEVINNYESRMELNLKTY